MRSPGAVATWRLSVLVIAVSTSVAACSGGGSTQGSSASPAPAQTSPSTTASTPAGGAPTTGPTTAPTSSGPSVVARSRVGAYFVRQERLAAAARAVSGPAVATAAVRALLAGPTADERSAGMSTAVPQGTQLRSLTIAQGVAVVDLSGAFASGGGSLSMGLRLAQLVTTVTQFPSASGVRLWLDGRPVTTLGGEGLMVGGVLERSDVEEWLPAVLVDSPATGERVPSPVRVTGSANVFEAVFFLELLDGPGRVVATRRVVASAGTGTRGTFSVTMTYRTGRGGAGTLVAYTRSPRDGSRVDVARTPLRLVAS